MKALKIKRGNFFGVAYSADGRYLLSGNSGRHLRFWNLETFEERLRLTLPHDARSGLLTFYLHGPLLVMGSAFHPGGNFLVAGSREGEVRVWDARDGKQVATFDWQIGAVHGLAFALDGMTVAAAGHNGSIMVWDFE